MQRSNRTELCDATRNKKQSGFETHLGSDATITNMQCYGYDKSVFKDLIKKHLTFEIGSSWQSSRMPEPTKTTSAASKNVLLAVI